MDSVSDSNDGDARLDLRVEEVQVLRRPVETGRVRVETVTHERDAVIDELLASQYADVTRITIGEARNTLPKTRVEGDVVIVPIVEEIIVVEKRFFLKEEVHIRIVTNTTRHQETVTLREQEAVISRPIED